MTIVRAIERESTKAGSQSEEKISFVKKKKNSDLSNVLSLASFLLLCWSPSKLGRSAHYTFMRHRSLLNVSMRVFYICVWNCEYEYSKITRRLERLWNSVTIQENPPVMASVTSTNDSRRSILSVRSFGRLWSLNSYLERSKVFILPIDRSTWIIVRLCCRSNWAN